MSVKSPAKSDLLDRHEVYETEIEIALRELELQPEAIENGVLSSESRELMHIFKEDLERTSEFMTPEEFKHYVRRETRKYILKIRNLKLKNKEDEHSGKKKRTYSNRNTQEEKQKQTEDQKPTKEAATNEVKTPVQTTVEAIERNKQAQNQKAGITPTTAATLQQEQKVHTEGISRGHDVERGHESPPERLIPKQTPTKAPINTLLTALEKNKAAQQKPPAEPLKIKYTIPAPVKENQSTDPEKLKLRKYIPIIPQSEEVTSEEITSYYERVSGDEGSDRPFKGNPREYPPAPPREFEYPNTPEYVPGDGGYGDDGSGSPPNRPAGPKRLRLPGTGYPSRLPVKFPGGGGGSAVKLAASTPWGRIAILVAIILLLLIILIIIIIAGDEEERAKKAAEENAAIAKLTITKTGPTTGAVNTEITYDIKAAYPGTAQDVIIRDTLPVGVQYAPKDCTAAKYDPATRTITWSAKEILAARGQKSTGTISNVNMTIKLTVRILPEANNKHIINQAIGEVVGASNGGSNSTPGTAPNVGAGDFESLVKGQGRNTSILGDENQFVTTLMKNGAKNFTGKEAQLRQLYKAAIAKNVNPLIMAVIWGVEAGFRVNGTEFGCKPFGSGFASQVSCSANTLNKHMADFEKANKNPFPHPVAPNCTYSDPFVYAYERYTPVCAINDSNGHARENFVKFFKELYGTK